MSNEGTRFNDSQLLSRIFSDVFLGFSSSFSRLFPISSWYRSVRRFCLICDLLSAGLCPSWWLSCSLAPFSSRRSSWFSWSWTCWSSFLIVSDRVLVCDCVVVVFIPTFQWRFIFFRLDDFASSATYSLPYSVLGGGWVAVLPRIQSQRYDWQFIFFQSFDREVIICLTGSFSYFAWLRRDLLRRQPNMPLMILAMMSWLR